MAARARQRKTRILVLSTAVLLLMTLGLYYGLSRQDAGSPLQGTRRLGVSAGRGQAA